MRRIQNIQALRGAAALLVVLFHLVPTEQKYGGGETILSGSFQFGMFGVDLFFVISGFVMVVVTSGQDRNPKNAFKFIYRRASRIYPTYWVYTLLVLYVFLIHPSWVNSSQGNQANILTSFLLLPSDALPLVMVGWTLIHEMYFYLVFFLMLLFVPEKRMGVATVLWGLAVLSMNLLFQSNQPLARIISHPLTLEFIAGCLLAIVYYRNSTSMTGRSLMITACLGFFVSFLGYHCYHFITGQVAPQSWWRVLMFGGPASLMVFCLVHAETKGLVAPSPLIKMGNASYSIYLSHLLTLSATGRCWHLFASSNTFDNYIMIPLMFMLVVMVGMISYHVVEKPLLKISRKIV